MSSRTTGFGELAVMLLLAQACGADSDPPSGAGGKGSASGGSAGATSTGTAMGGSAGTTAGSGNGGQGGTSSTGGATGSGGATTGSGGATGGGKGGAAGAAGAPTGGTGGGGAGTGGTGTGGTRMDAGTAGKGGAAGSGAGGSAGSGGTSVDGGSVPLDCGPTGITIEGHGPPANRINYVIVGDCYNQADIDGGLYLAHINKMLSDPMRKAGPVGRFTEPQQPYLRYRNFVNICALKTVSVDSVCGTAAKNTAFDGYGNDSTRLGYINNTKVNNAIKAGLPASITVDWKAVVLNAASWWNSGGIPMVWSGGHVDAALAAQHEGGHGFFALADEYGGSETAPTSEPREINVTIDPTNTANKWSLWLGVNQTPGTGVQGAVEGGRYCDKGVWRPTKDSMMNSLWASSYFNSISLENAVRKIYALVTPIDSTTPTTVTSPQVLEVTVVDPSVIKIDWSVDGVVTAAGGGATFDVVAKALPSGSHKIAARAYDDTAWVKGDRSKLEQTVTWTIVVP